MGFASLLLEVLELALLGMAMIKEAGTGELMGQTQLLLVSVIENCCGCSEVT